MNRKNEEKKRLKEEEKARDFIKKKVKFIMPW